MLLFQRGVNAVYAGVAAAKQRARVIGEGIPVRADKVRGVCELFLKVAKLSVPFHW